MKKTIYLFLAVFILFYFFSKQRIVNLGPGVMAADDPKQVNMRLAESFMFKNYRITPLAEFSIRAKVLSKKNYRYGRASELSPVDLALGWGNMSDENIIRSIRIGQSNRWYRWWTRKFPISRREIETHSANMHLIPANNTVKSAFHDVRKGDIVEFSGNLIRIDADDGWYWVSSLTRNDTGGHSCELIWIEDFSIEQH